MLSYILRHLWLLFFGSKENPQLNEEFSLRLRSWVTDCDINLHVNTARYFVFMELGRFDLSVRSGLYKYCLKNGIKALVLGTKITFRREIKPFRHFEVKTKILAHDHRFIYFEQRLVSENGLHSKAYLRTALYGKNGFVDPEILKEDLELKFEEESLPEDLELWIKSEDLTIAGLKKDQSRT